MPRLALALYTWTLLAPPRPLPAAIRPAPAPEAPPRFPRVRCFLRKRKAERVGCQAALEFFSLSVNVCCALSRPTGSRHAHLQGPAGSVDSPVSGEAASSPRSWDSGEPGRPPRPPCSHPLPSRLLRPIVLSRRPPFLVSPFSSPLGWTCDTQCFSVTSPSGWKMCSFDRWAFHLLIISVDTWARGIRRSSD